MCQGIDFHGSIRGGCSAANTVGKSASDRRSKFDGAGDLIFSFSSLTAEPAEEADAAQDGRNGHGDSESEMGGHGSGLLPVGSDSRSAMLA